MKRALIVALTLAVGVTGSAEAHLGLSEKYQRAYWKVVRQHGKRAAGRNIVYRGVKYKGHKARPATKAEKARSLRQLRQILHPAPRLLVRAAIAPSRPPAGVATAGVAVGSSYMACIIHNESGGNPQAVNGQYEGIGQWSPSSWARWGGTRYASHPTAASYQDQLRVLASEGPAMHQEQGQYDGCG